MCDLQNNVRYIWQLLSQFVSWEFCRYMCEQDENNTTETDVLTFLRDMIVQRTEKSVSDITKHEIVAKFIMETRSAENVSRMPCITVLSESVNKICPELEQATNKLIRHLETFFNIRDHSDESRKELIQARIYDSINDFSKEAERLLPHPELLKVIESWNLHHGHVPQKPTKKVIYSSTVFEKVLECLHCEGITPAEAKLIAVSLYEDKEFERILLSAEAEQNETEADSEQFSLSVQSSQMNEHIFSQEFGKNVEIQKNSAPPIAKSSKSHVPVFQTSTEIPEAPNEMFNEPPDLSPIQSPVQSSHVQFSPAVHVIHDASELYKNQNVQNSGTDNHMQFAQSSGNESPSHELNSVSLHDNINKKFQLVNYQRTQNQSDSDTSDCDKNPQFKFLTPTLYKQGTEKTAPPKSQIVWLSDNDSNDSSVITTIVSSQQNDPNWSSRQSGTSMIRDRRKTQRTRSQALHLSNNNLNAFSDSDSDDLSNQMHLNGGSTSARKMNHISQPSAIRKTQMKPTKKKVRLLASDSGESLHSSLIENEGNSMTTQMKLTKKKVRQLASDSSESPHSSLIENEGNLLHRLQQLPVFPVTSVNEADAESNRPIKKRILGKSVKLYSPNRSMQDFVSSIRRPVPVPPSEVPLHKGTNTTRTKRKKPQNSGQGTRKRNKCEDCSKTFKTAVALRRHVFLKHTEPLGDSDCDS